MTDTNHTDSVEALVKELRMVADMINMGEKIQWGRETTLMDKAADMLETHLQELQKAREEKQNILTVGWHKGEMDFGINCDIDELDIKQMHEFRVMVCVAIGQAENMWRRAREKQNPAAVNNLSDQSELDQPIS